MGGSMLSLPERVAEIQEVAREGWRWAVQNRWAVAGVILGGGILYWGATRPRNLPPGPRGLPILGNIFTVSDDIIEDYEKIQQKFGKIFTLTFMGRYTIVLCHEELLKEAFLQNAEIFSHRPLSKVFQIMGIKDEMFTASFDDKWKAHKKFAITNWRTQGLGSVKGEAILLDQMDALFEYINENGSDDIDIRLLSEKVSANVIYTIAFTKSWPLNDPELAGVVSSTLDWVECLSLEEGALANLPLAISRFILPKTFAKIRKIHTQYMSFTKKLVDDHIATFDDTVIRDVVDSYIKERLNDVMDLNVIAGNTINFTTDAIHTSNALLSYVIFYLAKYPDVQKRIQEQLDAVIGLGCKVTMKDKTNLPLLNAAILETFRISPPFPIIGERVLKQEVELGGFTIPKGALVQSSIFSFNLDKTRYATPRQFNIDHFLNPDGSLKEIEPLLHFGIGSRMCSCEQYVKMFLFVFTANILLRYKIKFPDDYTPPGDMERNDELAIAPKPHTINLIER